MRNNTATEMKTVRFAKMVLLFSLLSPFSYGQDKTTSNRLVSKNDSNTCGIIEYAGFTYHTVIIGTQCWMVENMNIGKWLDQGLLQYHTNNSIIEKYCYGNDFVNCDLWGGLYQWEEAMQYTTGDSNQGICPRGWHVPESREWATLINFLGGNSIAGAKLKSTGSRDWRVPNVGAKDSYGFTAFPGGYFDYMAQRWTGQFTIGHYWSSTIMEKGTAVALTLTNTNADADLDEEFMPFALSVRCIKNH
jgi:uncharacterized protein (TIGR02145 family)